MLLASGVFASSSAYAEAKGYRSSHPIPAAMPGSFCYIDASHTHTYTPDEESAASFVQHDAEGMTQLEFVGDPMALGFEGPVTTYGESHPMHFQGGSSEIEQVCHVEGTHYHLREPLDPTRFEERKGTYYFVSYKAAMSARKERRKLLRAEARELQKSERQRLRAAKLEERAARKANKKARRASSKSATARAESSSATTTSRAKTTSTTNATSKRIKSKSKPPQKGFRSWMDRRRGK
jgi:hypothetical protein